MKTIVLQLSADSCKEALKELKEYQSKIEPLLDRVCKRLADIGAEEARLHAMMAKGYGNDDVQVSVERMENGYKVVMSGSDIYFVEFGTGIFAGDYPRDVNVSVGIMPGDWSETHAQKYSKYGYWFYDNVFYRGTPAEMPMYWAGRRMREEMPKIVKEVFGTA